MKEYSDAENGSMSPRDFSRRLVEKLPKLGESFEELARYITAGLDKIESFDEVDKYLDNLYDLADANNVWVKTR